MKLCRMCLQQRKLVKSHVIPEAFFRVFRSPTKSPLMVTSVAGQFNKISPIGPYDKAILCEDCEKKFDSIDNYGVDVLLRNIDKHFEPHPGIDPKTGNPAGFQSYSIDREKLLQFLVTVVWRASVSTNYFYSNVNLGPLELTAKDAVESAPGAISPVFDAIISRWCDKDGPAYPFPVFDPMPERIGGANTYRVYFGEIIAFIKTDPKPFAGGFGRMSIRNHYPTLAISRYLEGSNDLKAMVATVGKAHLNQSK